MDPLFASRSAEAQRRHDAAIWRTLQVNELIDVGRFAEAETVEATFPPQLVDDERFLGAGPYELLEYGTAGDGTFTRNTGSYFASGPVGLALTGGLAAARAITNANRRARAAADARPAWRLIDHGQLWVSQYGFYLRASEGFHVWNWGSVIAAELLGPGRLLIDGDAATGRVRWILAGDWSELVFTMWARARHPKHPQFVGRAWVPPGWEQRMAAAGYQPPPALSGRWQRGSLQDR